MLTQESFWQKRKRKRNREVNSRTVDSNNPMLFKKMATVNVDNRSDASQNQIEIMKMRRLSSCNTMHIQTRGKRNIVTSYSDQGDDNNLKPKQPDIK